MSLRDDFGSNMGTPGGYSGGAGGLGNGGVGGGMGGGFRGGGAGVNGGIGSRTGLSTGNRMNGTSAAGFAGGRALGYGMNANQAQQNMQGLLARLGMGMPQHAAPTSAIPGQPPQVQPPLPPYTPPPAVQPPLPPAPVPGLEYQYNTALPQGFYPGSYWAGGTGRWGALSQPGKRGPSTGAVTRTGGPGGDQWGPGPESYNNRTGAY